MDLIDEMTYSAKASMNQLVFDQGARVMDALPFFFIYFILYSMKC